MKGAEESEREAAARGLIGELEAQIGELRLAAQRADAARLEAIGGWHVQEACACAWGMCMCRRHVHVQEACA